MDRVFSTRLDVAVIEELARAAKVLRVSKKSFLEEAIRQRLETVGNSDRDDVWSETSGLWKRDEEPEQTVQRAKGAFRTSFARRGSPRP